MMPGTTSYTTITSSDPWNRSNGQYARDVIYIDGVRYVRDSDYGNTITISNDPYTKPETPQNRKERRTQRATSGTSYRIPRRGNKRFKRAMKHK